MHPRPLVTVASLLLFALGGCASDRPSATSPRQPSLLAKADPDMRRVLDAHASLRPKPIETLTPAQARRQPTPADAVTKVLQDKGEVAPQPMPPVGRVERMTMPGPDGNALVAKVYTPKGDGPFPAIVYFHGGGWVLATPDTYDASARALCAMAGAVVVSVDYRRAPEHKFPAAHEDAYAALQHVIANAARFRADPARVAVAGESAGANLATAACITAGSRGGVQPVHQLLVYPIADYGSDTPSYRENAMATPLNAAMMAWFFEHYLNSPADGDDVRVSPLRASAAALAGLPPATIITAEIDPLRSEGMAYADKLRGAGVDVESRDYKGATHEFFGMAAVVGDAKTAQEFAVSRLRESFQDRNRRTAAEPSARSLPSTPRGPLDDPVAHTAVELRPTPASRSKPMNKIENALESVGLKQPGADDSVRIAKEANHARFDRDEDAKRSSDFMAEMADARLMDTEEGRLASTRGIDPEVRAYGELMIRDQAELYREMTTLAAAKGYTLPTRISNLKADGLADLEKKTAHDLDEKFLKMICIDHERDVKEFKKAMDFKDVEVSAFAARRLPLIEEHLRKADQLAARR